MTVICPSALKPTPMTSSFNIQMKRQQEKDVMAHEGRSMSGLADLVSSYEGLVDPRTFKIMEEHLPPLRSNTIKNASVPHAPSWFNPSDCLKFTLAWAAKYESHKKLEEKSGVPQSSAKRVIKWVLAVLQPWIDASLNYSPYNDRVRVSKLKFPDMPAELGVVTVMGDTTDIPRTRDRDWSKAKAKQYYSFKLKKAAYRLMVPPLPASTASFCPKWHRHLTSR